jgi:hypothetical protein
MFGREGGGDYRRDLIEGKPTCRHHRMTQKTGSGDNLTSGQIQGGVRWRPTLFCYSILLWYDTMKAKCCFPDVRTLSIIFITEYSSGIILWKRNIALLDVRTLTT